MLGIRYLKAPPTSYVMQFKGGRLKREGPGLSFFFYAPTSTVVSVPLSSADLPFVFNETASDFQSVTVQGQLTWRVVDARRVSALLDFSVDPEGRYLSDDPETLSQRLVSTTQVYTRAVIGGLPLRQALAAGDTIVVEVLRALRACEEVQMLGVEILALAVQSVRPTPEMAKALEAEAREALQRRADEAIYARRNAAVEQERTIKESELNTELAVEEKRRQIREAQMAAEISVEQQRTALIDRRSENERKDADAKAYAMDATLRPLREMDWRILMALASGKMDPRTSIAMAFRDLAENAHKIGELNISPDLLSSLVHKPAR